MRHVPAISPLDWTTRGQSPQICARYLAIDLKGMAPWGRDVCARPNHRQEVK